MRALAFSRNAASPTPSDSSISRMSGSTSVAMREGQPHVHAAGIVLERHARQTRAGR